MAHARLSDILAHAGDSSPEWRPLYDQFIDGLRALGIGAGAPQLGEIFPAFSIPDATGRYRRLATLIENGPLVLSFNRGGWCPYCTHELALWNEYLPELHAAGGHLAVVTGEVGGRAAMLGRLLGGNAEMLCDVDHGVALTSGLAFYVGDRLQHRYEQFGLDLAALYGSASRFLPVPATFVIDSGGIVRYSFVDPDFRIRAEPEDVVAAVAALGGR